MSIDDLDTLLEELAIEQSDQPDLSHDQLALELSNSGWALNARYCPESKLWLFWNGFFWEWDKKNLHKTKIREFLRKKAHRTVVWAEKIKNERALKWANVEAKNLRQAPTCNYVETTARSNSDLVVSVDQFDADIDLLGAPNGTVDLRTGILLIPKQENYITRKTAVVPAAESTSAPLWHEFLKRSQDNNPEIISFLQRLAGYMLTGHTREHKLPFIYGPGGNGKSIFINTIFELMGDYARRAPAEMLLDQKMQRHPTEIAGLRGARFVVASELPSGHSWNEAIVKDLVSGDKVTARLMRQDFVDYIPQFTLCVVGNSRPPIGNVNEAMRRRLLLIPFVAEIPDSEKDFLLPEKLRTEHEAILRWMIDGSVEWYRHGLNPPQCIIDASRDYLDSEDLLGEFVSECLIQKTDSFLLLKELYRKFSEWYFVRGMSSPWSQQAFTRSMCERGFKFIKRNNGKGLLGYTFITPTTAPDYYQASGG